MIRNGQKAMGRDTGNGNIISRARHGLNMLSILITWALENAIGVFGNVSGNICGKIMHFCFIVQLLAVSYIYCLHLYRS